MLYKNNMTPAAAYAGTEAYSNGKHVAQNDSAMFAKADEDDFGSFTSGSAENRKKPSKKQAPERSNEPKRSNEPSRSRKSSGSKRFLPFIIAIIAVIAVILLIIVAVAVFNTSGSGLTINDTVYFSYIDDDGKYHVLVNGDEINETFENEIKLIPAANNAFAYILEKVDSDSFDSDGGTRIHILTGKKLDTLEGLVDECLHYSEIKPGVIYKHEDTISRYLGGNSDNPITKEPTAKDFIISADSKTVVYTVESKTTEGVKVLQYYKNSGTEFTQARFTPVALSPNGRYVYATDDAGSLYYIDAKEKEPTPKRILDSNNGVFGGITAMNADGNEIVFWMDTAKGVGSCFYQVGDKNPKNLTYGVFTPVNPDSRVLYTDSLLNSYFTVKEVSVSYDEDEDEDEDENSGSALVTEGESVSTYYLSLKDKKVKATKIADAEGKFSVDGKYFFYIMKDDNDQLVRVTLGSDDFTNVKKIDPCVTDFVITQKGDLYIFYNEGSETQANTKLTLRFWDSSKDSDSNKSKISTNADADSLRVSVNTVYFSETSISTEDGDSETTIYVSTDGSKKSPAEFKSTVLHKIPTIEMGVGKNGYAHVTDDSGVTMLFFTSNGKTFDVVSKGCTLPGAAPVAPPTSSDEDDSSDSPSIG